MGEGNAWVTLATNDSYCLGALVLAHSLRRAGTVHPMAILVTPGVTPIMKERLSQVFSQVVSVDVLDSGDAAHLALLARPELGITFTKLHCWSLTQYSKCVFLDADTLVLQNCDELFEKEELSAAPDVGWPDCFNSGVFVYRPSNETFQSLVSFAKEKGSFDGGDQGLLNQYFSNWSTGDISKHLSFLYNVCSTSFYSYLPALKQYGKDMKIVHFIGNIKPWLQKFNWGSCSVMESGTLQGPLQLWWDIFIDQVHPVLDVAMAGLAGALSQMSIGSEESIPALDEHLRRQGWEAGNIDYLGADKFDNIWAKISQTLSVASPPEPALPPQTTPTPTSSPAPEEQTEEAACTLPCVQQAGVVCTRPCAQLTDAPVCTRPCAQVAEAPVCTRPCAQVAEAPVCSRPASEKSDTQRSSVSTTDSWENVESCTMTPAESVASSLSLVAKAPGESSESSIESSTDSSFSSVPSMAPTDEKDSQAMTEKKKDNKRAEVETKREPASVPPPKPMEKLVCHLKPAAEVDPLLTPDSEQEDAATLAQSIIASEEALISSPVITSATPTVSSPVCSAVPQNIKDLSVETNLPGTPPASGPVSLAQIGILPSLEITAKETKASEIKEKVEAPKEPTTPEQVKPKTQVKSRKIVEQVPKTPETVEPKAPVKSPKEPKTPEKVEPKITKKVEPKTPETVEPKTPETVEPKKSGVELIKDPVKKVKKIKPKTTEAESDKNTLVCSLKTQDTPQKTIAEVVLPTDLENIKLPKNLDKALIKTDSVEEKKTVPSKVAEVTPKLDVAAKIEEPSSIATESEEVTVKPKVKKVVKKVPAAPKTKTEAEGAQGAELPVPPPRKKVVKPKEK